MATIPKLALIPSGYKAGKVYSVLPTDGSGDLDFARTTKATRVNQNGLIEELLTGVPRLDYTDGSCPSLLLEPTSRNLVINSAEGTYVSLPASSTNTISPDGTNNAYIPLVDSTSNRYEQTITAGTYATGQKLTYSWYRKRISTPTGDNVLGDLNIKSLVNLTELEASNARQVQTDINGFDRFEAVVQIIDGSLDSIFRAYYGSVVGLGNSSVAYWGHQFEALEYSTSIIITTGTAQTRTADTANNAGNASTFNDSEGVLMAEISRFKQSGIVSYLALGIGDGIGDNEVVFKFRNYTNIFYATIKSSNGTTRTDLHYTFQDLSLNTKIALKYKTNDFALWVNGYEVATSNNANSPIGLNEFNFGTYSGGESFEGNTKQLQYFDTALTDSEIETLTSYTSFNAMALAQNYTI